MENLKNLNESFQETVPIGRSVHESQLQVQSISFLKKELSNKTAKCTAQGNNLHVHFFLVVVFFFPHAPRGLETSNIQGCLV